MDNTVCRLAGLEECGKVDLIILQTGILAVVTPLTAGGNGTAETAGTHGKAMKFEGNGRGGSSVVQKESRQGRALSCGWIGAAAPW